MGRRRLLVFLLFCYIHAVAASAGPPAAAPPDLETLQRSLREGDGIGRVRRVVITKRTTEGTTPMGVEETTVETTTESLKEVKTTEKATEQQTVGTTESSVEAKTKEVAEETTTEKAPRPSDDSDFADPDFSAEKTTESEVGNDESTSMAPETTTEERIETTTESTTTATTTSTTTTVSAQTSTVEDRTTRPETTTETTTMEPTTVEKRRNTSPPKTTVATTTEKEMETTTTENRMRTESMRMGRRRVIIRKKKPLTEELENTTTMETTTAPEETTTKRVPQEPQDDDHLTPLEELRLLKKLAKQGIAFGVRNKELELIHNEKGELSLPPFAFSEDENSVVETTETEEATEETTPLTSRAPVTTASTTPEATTTSTEAPRTTTANAPVTTSVKEFKEKTRFESESFKVGTNLVPVHLFFNQNRMMRKRKRVRTTTAAPQVEEERRTSTISNEIPAKPRTDDFLVAVREQMSEKEEAKRLDSFTFPAPPPSTERTTMKPIPKSKMPEKMVLPSLLEMPKLSALSSFGSLSVPVHPMGVSQRIRLTRIDSEALAPPAVEKNRTAGTMRGQRRRRILRKKTTVLGVTNHSVDRDTVPRIVVRPRFVAEPKKHSQGPQEQTTTTVTVAQVVKTNDPALVEKKFAETLRKKPSSTMDLVVESLRKMKKANRILLEQRRSRARAASAGKTVQAATLNAHHHDGQVGMTRVEGSVDERRPPVVDRDLSRKTVDRDV